MASDRGSMLPADVAGAIVIASVVGLDPGGWYPFVVAKFAAVSLAVVTAWWIAVCDRAQVADRRLLAVFGTLLVVLVAAATVGRDPLYAWIGTPERHLGVATWLLFVAAFVIGARVAAPERIERFGRWVAAATALAGAYALVERWHPPIDTDADTTRLGGTYGSASFLGAALCLLLPVTVAVAARDASGRWRVAALVGTGLGAHAVVGSGTRAAWLGLVVAALTAIAARSQRAGEELRRSGRWVTPAAMLAAGGILAVATNVAVTARPSGGTSRLAEWALGWRIVASHPGLGVGPEGYRTALADGVTAAYERDHGRVVLPDRAHHVLLDVAAAGGVLAGTLYAVLAIAITLAAWRALRSGSGVAVGIAVAVLAYLVQQSFLFPVATIDPIFWLLAGTLTAVAPSTAPMIDLRRMRHVAVPVIGVLFVSGVLALAADRAAMTAIETSNPAAARRAIALRPDVVRYWLLAAELAPPTLEGLDRALVDVGTASDLTPRDPIVLRRRADLLTRRAIAIGSPDDIDAADRAWSGLTRDDPNCYPCQLGLGYTAALAGDVGRAEIAFRAATRLAPDGVTEAADALDRLARLDEGAGTDRGR